MFLGYCALRRYCAERIRGTYSPKNAIAKTRYLGGEIGLIRAFRTRSSLDMALPRPPVDRMTSNRYRKPRTDVLQIRDQKLSNSGFHNSLKFLGKGDSVSQTRICHIEGDLWTPARPRRDLGVLSLDASSNSPQFHVFGGHVTFRRKRIIPKIQKTFAVKYHTKRVALKPGTLSNPTAMTSATA